MNRLFSSLLVAALIGAPTLALGETGGGANGPAGGAFNSSYSRPFAYSGSSPGPQPQVSTGFVASHDVTATASTRRARRPRR